ncbi:MAG: hypothetical protein V4490_06115, partial [Pseudomonadota bacterium]
MRSETGPASLNCSFQMQAASHPPRQPVLFQHRAEPTPVVPEGCSFVHITKVESDYIDANSPVF